MKNRLIYFALVMMTAFAVVSCANEEEAGYPPVYGQVYCVNQNPVVGDSLIFKVAIKESGYGIYKAEYKWKVDGKTYKTVKVIDPLSEVPEIGFIATKAGTYRVSMDATFNMSIMLPSGQIVSSASAKEGSVKVLAN